MTEHPLKIIRTDADNPAFRKLATLLDTELRVVNKEADHFFVQFNGLEQIKHVVLAYQGEDAVGCGAFKKFSETSVEIKRMYVMPGARKQGVARAILNELECWAKELEYKSCVLETARELESAVALYQLSGYQPKANYEQYVGIESSICMEKHIRP